MTQLHPPQQTGGNKSTTFAIVIAVLAGLCLGGILFFRLTNAPETNTNPTVSKPVDPQTQPDVAETAKKPEDRPVPAPKRPKRQSSDDVVPISEVDTPPVLVGNSQPVAPASSIAQNMPPAMQAPAVASPAPQPSPGPQMRRRAVQESDPGTSSAAPVSPVANDSPPSVSPTTGRAAASPTKPAYTGPTAGMATWTGKLHKDENLTITGATASNGVLSGAGLPGVPVRVIIDQPNLGFVEMPNASNGYQRLVLKSHSSHDKITIHWTVVQ